MNERMTNDERTSGAGITEELREWIGYMPDCYPSALDRKNTVTAIADRIDERHERALADAELSVAPTEAQLSELGYVKLSVDADGVPIHVGDTMEWLDGSTAEVIGIGDGVFFYKDDESDSADWSSAKGKHHVKPDSWERIIADTANFALDTQHTAGRISLEPFVERCRRLAGERG